MSFKTDFSLSSFTLINIQNAKIMASGSITLWQIEEGKVQPVTDFIFLGFKITADGDCSHEIKRHMLLGRKAMTNLDSILKIRDITAKKVCIVKALVLPYINKNPPWVYTCSPS